MHVFLLELSTVCSDLNLRAEHYFTIEKCVFWTDSNTVIVCLNEDNSLYLCEISKLVFYTKSTGTVISGRIFVKTIMTYNCLTMSIDKINSECTFSALQPARPKSRRPTNASCF